jgi:hypothetical protein
VTDKADDRDLDAIRRACQDSIWRSRRRRRPNPEERARVRREAVRTGGCAVMVAGVAAVVAAGVAARRAERRAAERLVLFGRNGGVRRARSAPPSNPRRRRVAS